MVVLHVASVSATDCTHGEIRLVDRSSPLEGRVEICLGGQWGSVCANSWTALEASVACGQLGFEATGELLIVIKRGTYIVSVAFEIAVK